MKFYLSSYRLGDNPYSLFRLLSSNKRMAIIPNALDVYTDVLRIQVSIQREKEGLAAVGIEGEALDLRDYFNKPKELSAKLSKFGGLWVMGGNTFVLRRCFRQCGLDAWLLKHRRNRSFVYAGYSAGICVLTKDLKNLELMDEPNVVPEGYKPEVIWQGVGLVDFAIVPHYQSDHPETNAAGREVEYLKKAGIEYKALHDGEVIILDSCE